MFGQKVHIYKKDGNYYLLIAEGGTSYNHAIMVAISDNITGPYIPNDRNPIFSSRHLSYDNWVHSTGHGDLIELENGRWYVVMLGIRGELKRKSNMGRETFIAPVSWERALFLERRKNTMASDSTKSGKFSKIILIFNETLVTKETVFLDEFNKNNMGLQWVLDSAHGKYV